MAQNFIIQYLLCYCKHRWFCTLLLPLLLWISDLSVLETELQALPLHSDTLRVQKRKAELQVKFSEVEDAIKIFSKPKVFIKVDE